MTKNLFAGWALYLLALPLLSQTNDVRVGAGYFGETATHPGFALHLEYVRNHTPQISTPFRADLGAYFHGRNHDALIVDIHAGLREKFGKRFALEQYLGLGALVSFYNGDGIFQVDAGGAIQRVSPLGNAAFMPSVTLGIWIAAGKKTDPERWAVHFRPKAFWQFPYNNMAMPHFALQAGFTYRIKTVAKKKPAAQTLKTA